MSDVAAVALAFFNRGLCVPSSVCGERSTEFHFLLELPRT
jgi:hypothetical protein